MTDRDIYLQCLQLAAMPRKCMNYNYDSLVVLARDLYPDTEGDFGKINKLIDFLDSKCNSIYTFPQIDGKTVQLLPDQLNTVIEKTPPAEYVIELATKYYKALCEIVE